MGDVPAGRAKRGMENGLRDETLNRRKDFPIPQSERR